MRMGRKANWPPKITPHKASGRDRVRWKGVDHYLGPIGSPESRAAYVELIHRLAGEGSAPTDPATLTVRQVVALWAIHADSEHTPQEGDNYRHALGPLVSLHGALPAAGIGGAQLRAVQQEMASRRWRRSYINRCISRVKTVWRWAEEVGHVPEGSWAALAAVKPLTRPRPGLVEPRRVEPVPWVSVAHTAYLGAPPYLRLFILLGWWTGARPGELARLRVRDIDQRGEVWTAKVKQHKNTWRGHDRVIVFGPKARHLLEWRLLEATNPDDLVCPSARGRPLTRNALGLAITRACKRAGVPHWHAYQLRHAAKQRFAQLVGIEGARQLLGHKSTATTERYASGVNLAIASEFAKKAG
jgi:integrase